MPSDGRAMPSTSPSGVRSSRVGPPTIATTATTAMSARTRRDMAEGSTVAAAGSRTPGPVREPARGRITARRVRQPPGAGMHDVHPVTLGGRSRVEPMHFVHPDERLHAVSASIQPAGCSRGSGHAGSAYLPGGDRRPTSRPVSFRPMSVAEGSITCARCGSVNPGGSRFCNGCGARLEAAAPAQEARRTVTVLFVDVAGSTALGERLDPEPLRALIGGYFDLAKAVIERHGGTVEKFIGDA